MRHVVAVAAAGAVALGAAVIYWAVGPGLPATPGAAANIVGRVELAAGAPSPAFDGEAMVVVFAYAPDGGGQPLAIFRRPVSALPAEFKLDDSLAPDPAHRLSQVPRLVVGARLGLGGAALSQVGDWLAQTQLVAPGTQDIRLVLQPPPR